MQPQTETTAASVIAGLLTRDQLAFQFGRSERTVIRWEHAGLPVIKLGMTRLYDPTKVREWLLTHERQHGTTPKRGRPAKIGNLTNPRHERAAEVARPVKGGAKPATARAMKMNYSPERDALILSLREAGKNWDEIGAKLGWSGHTAKTRHDKLVTSPAKKIAA